MQLSLLFPSNTNESLFEMDCSYYAVECRPGEGNRTEVNVDHLTQTEIEEVTNIAEGLGAEVLQQN